MTDDPLRPFATAEDIRAAINDACSLNNPRLSEVDWAAVGRAFDSRRALASVPDEGPRGYGGRPMTASERLAREDRPAVPALDDPDQNVWDAIGDPEQPLTRVHEKQAPVVLSTVGGVELVAVSVDRTGLVRWEERATRVAYDALIAELASDLCSDKEPCKGHRIRAREYLAARPAVPALDVERLARAYINAIAPWYSGRPDDATLRETIEAMSKVAREYAKEPTE